MLKQIQQVQQNDAIKKEFNQNIEKQQFDKAKVGDAFKERKMNTLKISTKSQLFMQTIGTLNKQPHKRSEKEVQIVMECTEENAFFVNLVKQNGIQLHAKICKVMTTEFYYKDQKVFNINDLGENFYIILKGSVGIIAPIPWVPEVHGPIEKQIIYRTADENKQYRILKEVAQLYAGQSFGELALVDNKPRSATVVCKQDTHLGVLSKQNFQNILAIVERQKLLNAVDFFQKITFLVGFDFAQYKKMYFEAKVKKYNINDIVYAQGQSPSNEVYIVKQGEFTLSQVVITSFTPESEDDRLLFDVTQHPPGIRVNKKELYFEISKCVIHQIIGDEEVILKTPRECTLKCATQGGELYVFEEEDFYNRFYVPSMIQPFAQKIKDQKQQRLDRTQQKIVAQKNKFIQDIISKKVLRLRKSKTKPSIYAQNQLDQREDSENQHVQDYRQGFASQDHLEQGVQSQSQGSLINESKIGLNSQIGKDTQSKREFINEGLICAKRDIQNKITLQELLKQKDIQFITNANEVTKDLNNLFFQGGDFSKVSLKERSHLHKKLEGICYQKISSANDRTSAQNDVVYSINSEKSKNGHYNPLTSMQHTNKIDIKEEERQSELYAQKRQLQTKILKKDVCMNILYCSIEASKMNIGFQKFNTALEFIKKQSQIKLWVNNGISMDGKTYRPNDYRVDKLGEQREKCKELKQVKQTHKNESFSKKSKNEMPQVREEVLLENEEDRSQEYSISLSDNQSQIKHKNESKKNKSDSVKFCFLSSAKGDESNQKDLKETILRIKQLKEFAKEDSQRNARQQLQNLNFAKISPFRLSQLGSNSNFNQNSNCNTLTTFDTIRHSNTLRSQSSSRGTTQHSMCEANLSPQLFILTQTINDQQQQFLPWRQRNIQSLSQTQRKKYIRQEKEYDMANQKLSQDEEHKQIVSALVEGTMSKASRLKELALTHYKQQSKSTIQSIKRAQSKERARTVNIINAQKKMFSTERSEYEGSSGQFQQTHASQRLANKSSENLQNQTQKSFLNFIQKQNVVQQNQFKLSLHLNNNNKNQNQTDAKKSYNLSNQNLLEKEQEMFQSVKSQYVLKLIKQNKLGRLSTFKGKHQNKPSYKVIQKIQVQNTFQ